MPVLSFYPASIVRRARRPQGRKNEDVGSLRPRTIADCCRELGGASLSGPRFAEWWRTFARWPPNVFALTSVLLGESGAYRMAVSPPGAHAWPPAPSWSRRIRRTGKAWRAWAVLDQPMPPRVAECGQVLGEALPLALRALEDPACWRVCAALLELHASADEACAGAGLSISQSESNVMDVAFLLAANRRLSQRGTLAELSPEVVRVLPKLRTPQVGISLRSLSHNLSIHRSEVEVHWRGQPGLLHESQRFLNLLVLPWPLSLGPLAFRPTTGKLRNMDRDRFGFFELAPPGDVDLSQVERLIAAAQSSTGTVHGVVLPECAVREDEVDPLQECLARAGVRLLVTGVRGPRLNYAHLAVHYLGGWHTSRQPKHHRWCLDPQQIYTYHLGTALDPTRRWWEDTEVRRRELHVVNFNAWLTLCHLICEDLARQDPVAQALRSLGPTLVIALLLDGPQLAARWPARYAGVLADDPGSSVLTVTSLGMALRSRPQGLPPSRVVALWKDPQRGQHELSLDPSAQGLVLTLSADSRVEEWSADGRSDGGDSTHLVLSGVEQIRP